MGECIKKYINRITLTALFLAVCWLGQGCRGKEEGMESKYPCELAGKLKVPSLKEVSDNPYIYRYNHELCEAKGLSKGDRLSRRYLCMQAVYRANLDAYLLDVLNLKELDEELRNSILGFARRKTKDRDLYERESTMGLEFIYLRNNLYIEYLKEDELKLLADQLKNGKAAVTDELKDMVKETCREVVRVRNPKDWKDESRFLYSEAQGYKPVIPNQALVLEISNAMAYDASGNLLPGDHMEEKCEYLDKIKREKEQEYSGLLGMEVYILLK